MGLTGLSTSSIRGLVCVPLRSLSQAKQTIVKMTMRAVRVTSFGGPDVLRVDDLPVPSPGENSDQILIKVMSAAVNPVDTYIRSGNYARLPTLPYTPGLDVAGLVEKVGSKVTKFKPGDRVYTFRTLTGGYAEYTLAEEKVTFPLLECLSFTEGGAIGTVYFTAYRALFTRGSSKPGETVLIHGASGGGRGSPLAVPGLNTTYTLRMVMANRSKRCDWPIENMDANEVGLAACQLARARGMTVLGTAGSESGTKMVQQCGAHQCFNHKREGYVQDIKEATKDHGIDIILEMLSNINLETDLHLLGADGRVMVVGSRGRIEIDPRLTMGKETDIRGVMMARASQSAMAETGAALLEGQRSGWLRPVIGHVYTLEDAAQAHREIISHSSGTQGKIMLRIRPDCE